MTVVITGYIVYTVPSWVANAGPPPEGTFDEVADEIEEAIEQQFASIPEAEHNWSIRAAIDHGQDVFVAGLVHKEDQNAPPMPPRLFSIFGNNMQIVTLPVQDQFDEK